MSDTLTSLTTLTSSLPGVGGGALGNLAGLVAGQLSSASWRGVPFYMRAGEEEAGHRPVKFLYPGQDRADFQFLGAFDGPMRVEGLLIGADCVAQASAMRTACRTGGKGKLLHPWFGMLDAVLTEPARFSVGEAEFGIVRFSATFERFDPPQPPGTDFFGQLQDAVGSLMGAATGLLSDVMTQLAGPLALYSFASGLLATAAGVWTSLGIGSSAVQAATAPAVLALATASPPFDANFPAAVSALLAAPALALADASQPPAAPVVGPGPTATQAPPAIDPADAAAALLAAGAGFVPPAGASAYVQAIVLSAQIQAAAQAAAVGATIAFADTLDAAAWRDQLDAAMAGLQAQAAQLASVIPLSAGPAWRAVGSVRQAALADCNSRLVNLPSLLSVTTTRTLDAWKIALALFGDTPEQMAAAVADLWARNLAASNPAAVPPGTYAVLP